MAAINYFWTRHEGIVKEECFKFLRKWGGSFDEIFSDAYMGFAKCLRFWTPERGAFSTLLVRCVRQAIKRGYDLKVKRQMASIEGEIESKPRRSMWENLKGDAAMIAEITLSLPKRKKKKAFAEAITELGFSGERITAALREIKEVLV